MGPLSDKPDQRCRTAHPGRQQCPDSFYRQPRPADNRDARCGSQHSYRCAPSVSETLRLSRQALDLLPEESVSWRCMAAINLGVTCAYIGEVQEAGKVLSYAMELSQEIGSAFAMVSAFWHLSSLQTTQLALRAAESTCQQLEQAVHIPGCSASRRADISRCCRARLVWSVTSLTRQHSICSKALSR
ncbi:MAG: hypothetical protein IPK52_16460 [Chloroflexi bacterium]|nr:hypothetical protein [Chloroflexota bacterium]